MLKEATVTQPNPEDHIFNQVRDILGKENSGMDLEEILAWLRRLQTQCNNTFTSHGIFLSTIDNMLDSIESAQIGVQATNNRINSLVALLDDITQRLDHQAIALNHLMATNEPIETPYQWAKRKAVGLWKTFSLKIAR
jgi:ethanolamine ammonia-lyase large subunit